MSSTLTALAVAAAIAAFAAESSAPAATPEASPATGGEAVAAKKRRGPVLRVRDSEFGPALVEKRSGLATYAFTLEKQGGKPRCYGGCADAWPPLRTRRRPVAGSGVDPDLLGTVERRNGGRMVTYDGRPLYFYVDDSPGVILCNDVFEFGGDWLVIGPDGTLGGS